MTKVIRQSDPNEQPPRIEPQGPEDYSKEGLEVLAALRGALSMASSETVPNFNATMFRHPQLMRAQAEFALQLFKGALAPRESELAILRTGWLCQAPYMFGLHVETAKRLGGWRSEDVDRIKIGSTADGWNEQDRAILRAVEELHAEAMIRDETWTVLAEYLDERQLIELPVLVGQYCGVAFLQNSLRVRLEPGYEGLSAR